jgi:hypothetical protein
MILRGSAGGKEGVTPTNLQPRGQVLAGAVPEAILKENYFLRISPYVFFRQNTW